MVLVEENYVAAKRKKPEEPTTAVPGAEPIPAPAPSAPTPGSAPKKRVSSPVYPPFDSAAAPPTVRPSPDDVPRRRHHVAPFVLPWPVQVALSVIPAVIAAFVSYGVGRGVTDAGYRATSKAVLELQDAAKEMAQQQLYLQAQVDALRDEAAKLKGARLAPKLPPPTPVTPKVTLTTLPADLSGVLQADGKPSEQRVLAFTPAQRAALAEAEASRAVAVEAMQKKKAEKEAAKVPSQPPDSIPQP